MPSHLDADLSALHVTDEFEPMIFEKAIISIRRGEAIGSMYNGVSDIGGHLCNYQSGAEMTWADGRTMIAGKDGDLSDVFYEVMLPLGYNVVGDPSVVFDRDQELAKAKHLIAARVLNVKTNICHEFSAWDGMNLHKTSGELFMEVEWTVYSVFNKKVEFKTRTTGYYKLAAGKVDGYNLIFTEAFSSAVQNFAAQQEFNSLLQKKSAKAAVPIQIGDKILIKRLKRHEELLQDHIGSVTDAVVTIRTSGGHGSGFVISHDGYILTNAHVVGEAKELPVIFKGSLELVGNVIRVDKHRDIALVKVSLNKATALPLEFNQVNQIDDVYAIGTPLDLSLQKTVTKGVVSAVRYDEQAKQPIIQADVDVQPGNSGGALVNEYGNVVGITVSGIGDRSIGLNFFIPVEDALKKLNIGFE